MSWPAALAEARATFVFEGPVRNAIHRLKYKGERARAEWGGRLMAGTLRTADWEADALIPTPLHRDRLRQRRYNQSRLLASVISGESGIPVRDVLIRHRSTHSQVALDADQRRANVAGAFSAVTRLDGLTVVLVDDVATTGATLVECAIACHAAGALMIRAIVLATDV